jgi:hypothetical protein
LFPVSKALRTNESIAMRTSLATLSGRILSGTTLHQGRD